MPDCTVSLFLATYVVYVACASDAIYTLQCEDGYCE